MPESTPLSLPPTTSRPADSLRHETKIRRPKSEKKRLFERIARWAKRLNRTHARYGNISVFDNRDFPWVADLEQNWRLVRAELDRLLEHQNELPAFHEIVSEFRTITRDRHWKTFFLLGYGSPSRRNIALCPETWRLVRRIPGIKTAMFSILEPGKHLPPHKGPYNGVLRVHLALLVPEPREKVGLRVEDRILHWEEGKVIVFDDYFEHEAWNGTPENRAVLFLDIVKPLRFPANLVNWLILNLAPFTPFVREAQENQKAWEKRFYGNT